MIVVLVLSLAIHCAYYIFIFSRLANYRVETKKDNNQNNKISIIICYQNEEENVDKFLPLILKQDVDELILVDDNSSDGTHERLNAYKSERVKVVSTKDDSPGKKNALSEGIGAAKYDTILLTDADCEPASEYWATHMSKEPSTFVLGYGPMKKVVGLVALFSRFETYMTALQYLSYSLAGIPYMGVGRNLKIERKHVTANKNKVKGSHLASGDDDLMINALGNRDNTDICIYPESFVYSHPKTTLKSFLKQKTRHISTSTHYKNIHKVLLVGFSVSQILFYSVLIIGLLLGAISFKIGLLCLLIKWLIQQIINWPVMKKLKEEDLFWKIPLLDILFFVYLLTMPFYYLFNKNNTRWS